MNSFVLSVRLNDDDNEKLEKLSKILGMTKAEAVRQAIHAAWLSYDNQSEEAKEALAKYSALSEFMKTLINN